MRVLGRWMLWSLLGFLGSMGLLRATSIRWWHVPDDDPWLEASVAPSLGGGDWILLWRLTEPSLGALVLCPEPKHADRMVIGRLVGSEGDRVRVEGTRVTVNDKPFGSEGDCRDPRFKIEPPQGGQEIELRCTLEAMHGVIHMRGNAEATAELPVFEGELGSGQAMLVSDNRRYPYDSRDFGPVDRATCTETVFFRVFGREGFFDEGTRFEAIR
jgi:signal peptidase I